MPRTSEQAVREIIETDTSISMTPFIAMANSLTNWLTSVDTASLLDAVTLELIERNLAAHFYQANRDRNFSSKATLNASGSYQGMTTMVLMSTDPGQTACLLDVTGNLDVRSAEAMSGKKKSVGIAWLGTESDSCRPDSYLNGDD